MTPKLLARVTEPYLRYLTWCQTIVAQDGRKFTWAHRVKGYEAQIAIGDKVWVANRLNVSKSAEWTFEVYQITIVEDRSMKAMGWPNYPHRNLGHGRRIIVEI